MKNKGLKPVWVILICIGLCGLCCCGGIGVLVFRGIGDASKVQAEAIAYSRESIQALGENWDPAEMHKRASPIMNQAASPEALASIFSIYRKNLGSLKKLQSTSIGNMSTSMSTLTSQRTTVFTNSNCVFAKGKGTVRLRISRQDAGWQIDRIDIDSHEFLRALSKGDAGKGGSKPTP